MEFTTDEGFIVVLLETIPHIPTVKELGCEHMESIHVAQDSVQFQKRHRIP
jgi:hypothetical protein